MRVVFVHGACVRDGTWWWHPTAELLQRSGFSSSAPLLPSCGETGVRPGTDGPGLVADVESVRAVLAAGVEPTVVVAHSYGGIVAAEAIAGVAAVRHLVLVSSYLPEPGESLSTFGSPTPPPFLEVDPAGGTFTARPELFAATFAQDCPSEVVAAAIPRLVRQSASVLADPVRVAGWREVPTTYLVCADDRGTPAIAQREYARRAGAVVELAAGHHPFLSRPDAVADLVAGLLEPGPRG